MVFSVLWFNFDSLFEQGKRSHVVLVFSQSNRLIDQILSRRIVAIVVTLIVVSLVIRGIVAFSLIDLVVVAATRSSSKFFVRLRPTCGLKLWCRNVSST